MRVPRSGSTEAAPPPPLESTDLGAGGWLPLLSRARFPSLPPLLLTSGPRGPDEFARLLLGRHGNRPGGGTRKQIIKVIVIRLALSLLLPPARNTGEPWVGCFKCRRETRALVEDAKDSTASPAQAPIHSCALRRGWAALLRGTAVQHLDGEVEIGIIASNGPRSSHGCLIMTSSLLKSHATNEGRAEYSTVWYGTVPRGLYS